LSFSASCLVGEESAFVQPLKGWSLL